MWLEKGDILEVYIEPSKSRKVSGFCPVIITKCIPGTNFNRIEIKMFLPKEGRCVETKKTLSEKTKMCILREHWKTNEEMQEKLKDTKEDVIAIQGLIDYMHKNKLL
jgi:hypothetical protein